MGELVKIRCVREDSSRRYLDQAVGRAAAVTRTGKRPGIEHINPLVILIVRHMGVTEKGNLGPFCPGAGNQRVQSAINAVGVTVGHQNSGSLKGDKPLERYIGVKIAVSPDAKKLPVGIFYVQSPHVKEHISQKKHSVRVRVLLDAFLHQITPSVAVGHDQKLHDLLTTPFPSVIFEFSVKREK